MPEVLTESRRRSLRRDLFIQKIEAQNRIMNPYFSPDFRDMLISGVDEEDARKPVPKGSKVKVVVSAHVVEVWEYEKPVQDGKRVFPESNYIVDEETGEIINRSAYDPIENKKQNSRRAKNELRRLILANFDTSDKFVTLTFRDGTVSDVTNVRECNQAFRQFAIKLKRRFGVFKYVKVIEFQDSTEFREVARGAVHFHILAKLPYIKTDELAEIWGNGFIGINRIEHVDNLGAYVTKYMVKDFSDMRLASEKAYSTSRGNLTRPIVLYGNEALEIMENYLQEKKEVFTNEYTSEYQGKITYKEYNLKRE